jgi:predicted ribosomally synthesized peptide with SipW-like signal peptide
MGRSHALNQTRHDTRRFARLRDFGGRKRKAALGAGLSALLLAGGAIAYWTSTGTGEGKVETKTSASAFTLENGAEPTGLYPGGSAEATVKVKNVESFGEHYKKLKASVKEVENAAATEAEAEAGSKCWAGWYEITAVGGHAGTEYEFNETVSGSSTVEKKVTVALKEVAKNQNGCQGKKVTLKYTVE